MLSRWRMQEQSSGTRGLSQLQLVFLELPEYDATTLECNNHGIVHAFSYSNFSIVASPGIPGSIVLVKVARLDTTRTKGHFQSDVGR